MARNKSSIRRTESPLDLLRENETTLAEKALDEETRRVIRARQLWASSAPLRTSKWSGRRAYVVSCVGHLDVDLWRSDTLERARRRLKGKNSALPLVSRVGMTRGAPWYAQPWDSELLSRTRLEPHATVTSSSYPERTGR